MFDADFYDWIMFTLHGNKGFEDGGTLGKILSTITGGASVSPRRNLLIVQFTNINIGNINNSKIAKGIAVAGAVAVGALSSLAFGGGIGGIAGSVAGAAGAAMVGLGPFQFATRIPARAWLLHNCLPTRYKAGSDFDASTASISLQELEVQPEHIEEFSLGIKP